MLNTTESVKEFLEREVSTYEGTHGIVTSGDEEGAAKGGCTDCYGTCKGTVSCICGGSCSGTCTGSTKSGI